MNKQKGNSTVVGIVIVVIVLLAGAWYVWGNRQTTTGADSDAIENQMPSDDSASSTESSLNSQSNSDEMNSIEADLKANSYENI